MYADFGYMEEGQLGKPYDLKLMGRLWVFLRPHWLLMAVSLLFVLIMAALDLFIPYLTKEAIDRYVIPSARQVVLKGDGSPEEGRLLSRVGKNLIPMTEKGKYLLPPAGLKSLDGKEVALFQKSGLLLENRFYLFIPERPEEKALLKEYPSLFEQSGSYWFISFEQMKEIQKKDLLILRGRDVSGVFHIALLVLVILVFHFGLNFFQVYAMEVAGQRKPFQRHPPALRDHHHSPLLESRAGLGLIFRPPSDFHHHAFLQPSGKRCLSRDPCENRPDECIPSGKSLRHQGGPTLPKGGGEWPAVSED